MVSANELCAAIESVLAIDYSKQYKTWKEQSILNLAKAIVKQYRDETKTLPSEESLNLKPAEAVTFEEGKVDELFDLSETTSPDALPPEFYASGVPSEVVPELVNKSVYWSFESVPAAVEEYWSHHPALPY